MTAIGQGQSNEGVGAGGQDRPFGHGLPLAGRACGRALRQADGAAEAGDPGLIRVGAQQADGKGQVAPGRHAVRVGDPVTALELAIVGGAIEIGDGQIDQGVAALDPIVDGVIGRGGRPRLGVGGRGGYKQRQNPGRHRPLLHHPDVSSAFAIVFAAAATASSAAPARSRRYP
ncbi:hypothetical protein D3C80_1132840 [compost metagenome]